MVIGQIVILGWYKKTPLHHRLESARDQAGPYEYAQPDQKPQAGTDEI
jgi:hypothetical protein